MKSFGEIIKGKLSSRVVKRQDCLRFASRNTRAQSLEVC